MDLLQVIYRTTTN